MMHPNIVYKYAIKGKINLSRSILDSQDLSENSLCFEIKLMPKIKQRNKHKKNGSLLRSAKIKHGKENIGSFLAGGDM